MTPRESEEYRALRETIRARGTARVWIFVAGFSLWAALTLVVAALALAPLMTLLPLMVLVATFEGVLALHVAVERIGRYLLVFYDDRWEQTAGAFGRPSGSLSVDALFSVPFVLAALLNALPLFVSPPTIVQEQIAVFAPPAIFILRLLRARAAAASQRAIDTERFKALRNL